MKIPKFRYVVAAMLFLATTINYADRLMLSVVSTEIRQDFGMDEVDYGHVVVWFMVAYAIMYAGSGPIADRLGTAVSTVEKQHARALRLLRTALAARASEDAAPSSPDAAQETSS